MIEKDLNGEWSRMYEHLPTLELVLKVNSLACSAHLLIQMYSPGMFRGASLALKTKTEALTAEIKYLKDLIASRPDAPAEQPPKEQPPLNPDLKIVRLASFDEVKDMPLGNTDQHDDIFTQYIIDNQLRCKSSWHQDEGCPVFSDGTTIIYSLRSWGQYMTEIWSIIDGKEYNYLDFYFD